MEKRLHGDPDRIMEHAEGGYCLSHSEELHLCKYTRNLRAALAEKTTQVDRLREALNKILHNGGEWKSCKIAIDALAATAPDNTQ